MSASNSNHSTDVKMEETDVQYEEVVTDTIMSTDDGDEAANDSSSIAESEDDSPLEELFSAVMTANENDRSISEMFQLLPSKSLYPDYFEIISQPIDLKTIATKIRDNRYSSLGDLEKDLLLMAKNAKKYNEPGSQIYRDAMMMRKIITAKKIDIEQRRHQPLKTSERIRNKKQIPGAQKWSSITAALKYDDGDEDKIEDKNESLAGSAFDDSMVDDEADRTGPYWQLYETIKGYGMNAKGVAMSDPFNSLPNRRTYPDYYVEIKRPISLSKIRNKINTGYYIHGAELVEDFKLMFENAKRYNRPDSKIYDDACVLQKITVERARELGFISNDDNSEASEDNDDSLSSFNIKKAPDLKTVMATSETQTLSPATNTRPSIDTENEESLDAPMTPIPSQPAPVTPVVVSHVSTPVTVSTVKKKISKRLVTGYIIFASEVRKSVVQQNPDCNFGDISRIIGTEWKNLATETKAEYEKKAQKQNEESAKEAAKETENYAAAPPEGVTVENGILECRWDKCDYQFEESSDLIDHLLGEPNGHVWMEYGINKDKEELIFQCMFHGCGRVKKGAPPFPSIQRLLRHCKEVHISKQAYKPLAISNRTKNYVPSKIRPRPQPMTPSTPVMLQQQTLHITDAPVSSLQTSINCQTPTSALNPATVSGIMPMLSPFWVSPVKGQPGIGVQVKPKEPLFVNPPRSTRLVHSSTYIKYIEGLTAENKHLSNWERELNATPENSIPNRSHLPIHWLENGAGSHGNAVDALWALRNFMLQDSFTLYKKQRTS